MRLKLEKVDKMHSGKLGYRIRDLDSVCVFFYPDGVFFAPFVRVKKDTKNFKLLSWGVFLFLFLFRFSLVNILWSCLTMIQVKSWSKILLIWNLDKNVLFCPTWIYLTPSMFSCLVSVAYLFCDLVYCLVGSTRRMSFSKLLGVS